MLLYRHHKVDPGLQSLLRRDALPKSACIDCCAPPVQVVDMQKAAPSRTTTKDRKRAASSHVSK